MSKIINYFTNFFSKGNQRSQDAKKNIVASFAVKGVSIAVSLILVPLTINYVSPTQYGIWLTLSSIIAWFSFFDIGFGNGLRNRFAEAKATGDMKKARIYVSTTYAILASIFTLLWLLFFIANYFIDWSAVLNAPKNMITELGTLALIVFSFFCLQMVLKTINTILIADQKPAKAAFFDMLGQLLALLVIFVLTKTTQGSLVHLGLTLGFMPIIVMLISTLWFFKTRYKDIAPSLKYVNLSFAKDIMNLGIKFFIIQIAVVVIYQTSNVIISHIGSPADVTVYNIAFKYFGIAMMIFSIVMSPFWSAFTDAFTSNEFDWMIKTVSSLRKLAFVLILVVIIMVFISSFAYKIWIGDLVNIRLSVSIIVALYVISNIWTTLHSLLLNGMGKIKLQLYFSLIGMIFNIPLAILLGRKYGLEGVVFSSVLLNIISAIYAPIQVNRILNKKAKGIWNE